MTLEQQYAHALHDLVTVSPKKPGDYLKGLQQTLKRKGHQKLMPGIYSQYGLLIEREKRSKTYAETTPESERTRALLELYRTLIATE